MSARPCHAGSNVTADRMSRLTEASLRRGLDRAAAADADVARALAAVGYPALRRRDPGFATLLRAIVGQQLSVASAAAIWGRIEAGIDPLTPDGFRAASDDTLRGMGLSAQKIRYGRSLSDLIAEGGLDLDALRGVEDEAAIEALIQIKGIGRWTAEVYLLFALGRPDAFPADDLALMIAAQRMKRLAERPDRRAMIALAEPWRPWRGAVAHLLWQFYRHAPAADAADTGEPAAGPDTAAPV
jgi:DNA-3-methyladenine glycosylase II